MMPMRQNLAQGQWTSLENVKTWLMSVSYPRTSRGLTKCLKRLWMENTGQCPQDIIAWCPSVSRRRTMEGAYGLGLWLLTCLWSQEHPFTQEYLRYPMWLYDSITPKAIKNLPFIKWDIISFTGTCEGEETFNTFMQACCSCCLCTCKFWDQNCIWVRAVKDCSVLWSIN